MRRVSSFECLSAWKALFLPKGLNAHGMLLAAHSAFGRRPWGRGGGFKMKHDFYGAYKMVDLKAPKFIDDIIYIYRYAYISTYTDMQHIYSSQVVADHCGVISRPLCGSRIHSAAGEVERRSG